MSPLNELAAIEGFDEETAQELQTAPWNSSKPATRRWTTSAGSWASTDEVLEVEGVTPAMAVALGEHGIKTLEDLAGCATDDLLGYYEISKDKERVRIPGALEGFNLTAEDANAIIMKARVKAAGSRRAGRRSGRRRPEGEETAEA